MYNVFNLSSQAPAPPEPSTQKASVQDSGHGWNAFLLVQTPNPALALDRCQVPLFLPCPTPSL